MDAVTTRTLAAAMERLIAAPEERLALARAAQAYVLAIHTPQQRAQVLSNQFPRPACHPSLRRARTAHSP
ncbi:MAG: hypothetical protein EOP73_29370 [Variovorax sp.]|nr:MAG: hypothetical protein EOP73_29370 [Variovorax sp.]